MDFFSLLINRSVNSSGVGSSELSNELVQDVFGEKLLYDFGDIEFVTAKDMLGDEVPESMANWCIAPLPILDDVNIGNTANIFYNFSIDDKYYKVASHANGTIAGDIRDDPAIIFTLAGSDTTLICNAKDSNAFRGKHNIKLYTKILASEKAYQIVLSSDGTLRISVRDSAVNNLIANVNITKSDGTQLTIENQVYFYTDTITPYNACALIEDKSLVYDAFNSGEKLIITVDFYNNNIQKVIYLDTPIFEFTNEESYHNYIFGEDYISNAEMVGS